MQFFRKYCKIRLKLSSYISKTKGGIILEDIEIIRLYRNRSKNAISESNKKYGAYCFTVANNILSDREDSEECVNDTWLRTWNVIPPQCPDRLKLFFAKITRSLSIDKLRQRNRKKRGNGEFSLALDELRECVPAGGQVEDSLDEKLLSECIDAFLREIPKRDRQMFLLRYFFTESVSKIASLFGMSENAVSVSLHRTRAKLKERLQKEEISI